AQPAPVPAPRGQAPGAAAPDRRSSTARPAASQTEAPASRPSAAAGSASELTLPALPEVGEPLPGSVVSPLPSPDISDPSDVAVLPADTDGFSLWPWAAALLALIAGGAYLLHGRRTRRSRYADFDRLAFAGQPDGQAELPRSAPKPMPSGDPAPAPWPTPKPKPAAKAAPPWPTATKPAPAPTSDPTPPPQAASDGGIVSTRLKPELNVEFVPDRAVVTDREVLLQFDVTIINSGSAPARDVLVEGKLVTAHAAQDVEIAGFFAAPAGQGDRMALIPPLGRVALKSAVRLPLDQLHSFEVDGRKLFVPLVALNILFRSGSGDGHASASYLVGRGGNDDAKLAPFRLDLGPRIFRGLSARPHSLGLQR
ncbi:MAG: hypothetical protein ACR2FK_01395, partial [Sphingomicrobium sp.]